MTTIQAQVPNPLAKQVEELARREKGSVCQLVSVALACATKEEQAPDPLLAELLGWVPFDNSY